MSDPDYWFNQRYEDAVYAELEDIRDIANEFSDGVAGLLGVVMDSSGNEYDPDTGEPLD